MPMGRLNLNLFQAQYFQIIEIKIFAVNFKVRKKSTSEKERVMKLSDGSVTDSEEGKKWNSSRRSCYCRSGLHARMVFSLPVFCPAQNLF